MRVIDREGKQMDGTSYNMQKEYWQEMDNTEAAMNPGFVAKPFPADKSISKHTREASIHTFFGPAKTKPRGDVKLQVERYVEPRKTLQIFPKEKDPIPKDLMYDKKRNEYSYIDWEKGEDAKRVFLTAEEANYGRGFSYGTPLYGKFKSGMGIIGTNVKTKLVKTPKHKLTLESAELRVLHPEDTHFHPPQPSPSAKMSMKPEKHVLYPEIAEVFAKKRAISYSKKRVSTKGDKEIAKKKKYEFELVTHFENKEPIQIIDKQPKMGDNVGIYLSFPQHGKWFGRTHVGMSLTGKAQTKVTKGGKVVYQTQEEKGQYFGRDATAKYEVSYKERSKEYGRYSGEGLLDGKKVLPRRPKKHVQRDLEPWQKIWKPRVVKFALPTRFEVATGVTVATGVSFATLAGIPRQKKPVSKKKKGGKR